MKYCPKCNTSHNKPGIFCSRSCANARAHSLETKLKIKNSSLGHTTSIERRDKISIAHGGQGHRKIKNCVVCGKTTNSIERITCSSTCLLTRQKQSGSNGGKKSASKRIKRSKDEIHLFNLCKSLWTNAEHNKIIIDGWDADIVLPDLKIAIMWNGPWHYKDMGIKNHSLNQVINRDNIKINLFKDNGWKVYIFEDRSYTPQKAFDELVLAIRNDLI